MLRNYISPGKLPFPSFCFFIGSSTFEAWPEYTTQPSSRLRFGTGSVRETNESREILRDADGIVLDSVALLTTHSLGLAEHLQTRFSRVAIPQHVFDEIQNNVYAMRMGGTPSRYLGKDEQGRYTHTELSDKAVKERLDYALSVL